MSHDSNYNYFGQYCERIVFGYKDGLHEVAQTNYSNCHFDDGVSYIYLGLPDKGSSYDTKIKNIHIHRGVKGEPVINRLTITPPVTDQNYEINYSMDPDGNIIQWTT